VETVLLLAMAPAALAAILFALLLAFTRRASAKSREEPPESEPKDSFLDLRLQAKEPDEPQRVNTSAPRISPMKPKWLPSLEQPTHPKFRRG